MENTVKLELNIQNLNIVLAGLAKLPLETSLETFMLIRNHADKQLDQSAATSPSGPLADKIIT